MYTRPFPSMRVGSGNETVTTLGVLYFVEWKSGMNTPIVRSVMTYRYSGLLESWKASCVISREIEFKLVQPGD